MAARKDAADSSDSDEDLFAGVPEKQGGEEGEVTSSSDAEEGDQAVENTARAQSAAGEKSG